MTVDGEVTFAGDRQMLQEIVSDAVRSAAHRVCPCGCVGVHPEFAAKHVLNRLDWLGLRIEGEPARALSSRG